MLGLAVLPLLWVILHRETPTGVRIARTFANVSPATAVKLRALESWDDAQVVLGCLPDRRIEGALLAVDTRAHWALVGGAAAVASALCVWAFGARRDDLVRCAQMALFTATAGIAGFEAVLQLSWWGRETWPDGGGLGWLGAVAAAYDVASDASRGFAARLLASMASVGTCEELCKAAPLIMLARGPTVADRRAWLLYGVASGLGFGLAEAVSYAEGRYNGFATGQTYLVRYVSCVASHGLLCASAALSLHGRLAWLTAPWTSGRPFAAVGMALSWPVLAHALYDALLEVDQPVLALASDLAVFAVFVWQVERGEVLGREMG